MEINFKIFDPDKPVFIPDYKTPGSAGMDIYSSLQEDIVIKPGETAIIPTNIILEISEGYEGQIRPRSGLAHKFGITVLNSPGTIDSDYRGEVKVLLINHGKKDFIVSCGDRIAQLVISTYAKINLIESKALTTTERGAGGYGSTGV
jgi:dUTP pyrophosphatase